MIDCSKSKLKTGNLNVLRIISAIVSLLLISQIVYAGDVVVEDGKIDVDSKLYVDDAGNVGIGTTGPNSKLHVKDAADAEIRSEYTGGALAVMRGAAATADYGSFSNHPVRLFTNSVEKVRIDASGNVGIGTPGPGYKLDVVGDVRAQNNWLRTTGSTGWFSDTWLGGWYMEDGTWIRSYNNKGIYTGGEMQAGTVRGNSQVCIGADCRISWPAGGDGLGSSTGTPNYIAKWTGNGTLGNSVIFDNGNVGIGTPGPGYKLDVVGDVRAQDAWLRTTGNTGWFSDTWLGGWYMEDGTWIRSYNNKGVYTGGEMQAGTVRGNSQVCIGADCRISWPAAGAAVPSGAIMMFESNCPAGWTRFASLDGRFPRGAASAGGTGGSATHSHTYSTVISHTHPVDPPATASGGQSTGHTHSGSTSSDGNHQHGIVSGDLDESHQSGTRADTAREIGDLIYTEYAGSHSHSFSTGGTSVDHTHTTDIGAFSTSSTGSGSGSTSSDSNIPPYYDIIFCRKD